jgi:hypothetical protein
MHAFSTVPARHHCSKVRAETGRLRLRGEYTASTPVCDTPPNRQFHTSRLRQRPARRFSSILMDPAAFGDWQSDAPGTTRHVRHARSGSIETARPIGRRRARQRQMRRLSRGLSETRPPQGRSVEHQRYFGSRWTGTDLRQGRERSDDLQSMSSSLNFHRPPPLSEVLDFRMKRLAIYPCLYAHGARRRTIGMLDRVGHGLADGDLDVEQSGPNKARFAGET